MTFKEKFKNFMTWDTSDIKNDVYLRSEIAANKSAAIASFNLGVVLLLIIILGLCGVVSINTQTLIYLGITEIEFFTPSIICFIRKGRGKALKYVIIFGMMLAVNFVYIMMSIYAALLIVIPLILSYRYYNKNFLIFTITGTMVMFVISDFCGCLYGAFPVNIIHFNEETTLTFSGYVIKTFINEGGYSWVRAFIETIPTIIVPYELIIYVIGTICVLNNNFYKKMADEERGILTKNARIDSELKLATEIQENMVPRVFPQKEEFEIYGTMTPAKEVGGDLYDFFMVNDHTLAIVIADVSGKGVPAALFMVTAKTLIKDHATLGLNPADVFTSVNNKLCEVNHANLFVTGWMGFIDLKTGTLTFVNAGHNSPLIEKNGKFEYLKTKHGLVLAGMDGIVYHQETLILNPGDKVFLYTDGITEATNKNNELYGEDRLLNCLNSNIKTPVKELLNNVTKDVEGFVKEAEQFDDMTMLSVEFIKKID